MSRLLILGATGSLARVVTAHLLETTDASLTLFARNTRTLKPVDPARARIVEGDVLDHDALTKAMVDQDIVYANLAGDLERMAKRIVQTMHETGLRRLIFISSMGIYDEVPGQKYRSILNPYRDSAKVIEASDLDYTILRPAWFTDADEIDYETTQKREPFRGSVVSRKSIADLIVKLVKSPSLELRHSVGINKPE